MYITGLEIACTILLFSPVQDFACQIDAISLPGAAGGFSTDIRSSDKGLWNTPAGVMEFPPM
ncbi:MAG: hypothetical protein DRH43_06690 [Deltaproteobacteria bacterium]|nr:MAG: hypothetical protein DRH43_06690 [Deltaproteobacteria bacterium]